MDAFLSVYDAVLRVLRPALLAGALILGVLALLDWMVRTRRVSPFSALARFTRDSIDPWFRPMERVIVRAGGNPVSAPFWALAMLVLGGIVALSLLGFVRDQVVMAAVATRSGPGGFGAVLVSWTFQVLRLALLVRVLCSWIRVSPYSRWVRWAFVLSEPMLRPLRRVIPMVGMIDITPIVAWFALGLIEGLVMRGLF